MVDMIRVTRSTCSYIPEQLYDVVEWDGKYPVIVDDDGDEANLRDFDDVDWTPARMTAGDMWTGCYATYPNRRRYVIEDDVVEKVDGSWVVVGGKCNESFILEDGTTPSAIFDGNGVCLMNNVEE